jgi:hypothetical protein
MRVGIVKAIFLELMAAPRPNSPRALKPQAYSEPSAAMANVEEEVAATALKEGVVPVFSLNCNGAVLAAVLFCPS